MAKASWVLIELCRIEMWEKGKRVFEVKAVLIELCRIEIIEVRQSGERIVRS